MNANEQLMVILKQIDNAANLVKSQAARIAELEAACKLENELKTAGSLRELKLMGEVGELRKQLADLLGDRDTLAGERLWLLQTFAAEGTEPDASDYRDARATLAALTRAGKDHP